MWSARCCSSGCFWDWSPSRDETDEARGLDSGLHARLGGAGSGGGGGPASGVRPGRLRPLLPLPVGSLLPQLRFRGLHAAGVHPVLAAQLLRPPGQLPDPGLRRVRVAGDPGLDGHGLAQVAAHPPPLRAFRAQPGGAGVARAVGGEPDLRGGDPHAVHAADPGPAGLRRHPPRQPGGQHAGGRHRTAVRGSLHRWPVRRRARLDQLGLHRAHAQLGDAPRGPRRRRAGGADPGGDGGELPHLRRRAGELRAARRAAGRAGAAGGLPGAALRRFAGGPAGRRRGRGGASEGQRRGAPGPAALPGPHQRPESHRGGHDEQALRPVPAGGLPRPGHALRGRPLPARPPAGGGRVGQGQPGGVAALGGGPAGRARAAGRRPRADHRLLRREPGTVHPPGAGGGAGGQRLPRRGAAPLRLGPGGGELRVPLPRGRQFPGAGARLLRGKGDAGGDRRTPLPGQRSGHVEPGVGAPGSGGVDGPGPVGSQRGLGVGRRRGALGIRPQRGVPGVSRRPAGVPRGPGGEGHPPLERGAQQHRRRRVLRERTVAPGPGGGGGGAVLHRRGVRQRLRAGQRRR